MRVHNYLKRERELVHRLSTHMLPVLYGLNPSNADRIVDTVVAEAKRRGYPTTREQAVWDLSQVTTYREILIHPTLQIYYLAGDAYELVLDAAAVLPSDYPLAKHDLPTEAGFVVFDRAFDWDGDAITAFAWGGLTGSRQAAIKDGSVTVHRASHQMARVQSVFATALPNCRGMFHYYEGDCLDVSLRNSLTDIAMMKVIVAFWQFVQQRIFVMTPGKPPRKLSKKEKREGRPPPPIVNIVTLRATEQVVQDKFKEHGEGDWTHRWVVRGHWRQQWYPSTKSHSLIWVAPYIKGPDGLPLIVKEKRFEVVR